VAKQTFILHKLMPRDKTICRVVDALEDLPISEGFRVEIHEHKATRSEKQNNTLWWVYDNIIKLGGVALEGTTKEELHDFFLLRHFGEEVHMVFGKKKLRPVRRSSRLSKHEFALFMSSVYDFMASQGVILPLPDPDYEPHEAEEAEKAA
jgi:hypothetical protein